MIKKNKLTVNVVASEDKCWSGKFINYVWVCLLKGLLENVVSTNIPCHRVHFLTPVSCQISFSLSSSLTPSLTNSFPLSLSFLHFPHPPLVLPNPLSLSSLFLSLPSLSLSSLSLSLPPSLFSLPLPSSPSPQDYDCLIVGAGPAGLSAAIRLKQLAVEKGTDVSVCVLEKGSEVGSHILSGNVFEPKALEELFPGYADMESPPPLETEVKDDVFLALTETASVAVPNILLPPQLHNDGNYIISLNQLTRWLGAQAEELGVEVYPGFAASEVLYSEAGAVRGIATRDVGIAKDGKPKDNFARGMEMRARQTLFAEGARGSCSEEVMEKFNLR